MWRAVGMKQTSDISFAPDWLALREPADHAARDAGLLAQAAGCAGPAGQVLDLGSGAGSTVRAFQGAGFDDLTWRLFDNDPVLLAIARQRHPDVQTVVGDLGAVADVPLAGVNLVTASALLDLMSFEWVTALAKRLQAANLPFYGALNYDGVMKWAPTHERDDAVTHLFNQHQQRDKGVGAALGPMSGVQVARVFEDHGFDVTIAQSPWQIGPQEAELHHQLLNGIADAVAELDDPLARAWHRARSAEVAQLQGTIGHTDILAVPQRPSGLNV